MPRDNPWYKIGAKVAEATNVAQALQIAGEDWLVEKRPAGYLGSDRTFKTLPGQHDIVRTDTDEWLGRVGRKYVAVQNHEAFAIADELVAHGLTFDAAGEYMTGKRVFLSLHLPGELELAGDTYDTYLMLTTSHDGKRSTQATVLPVQRAGTLMLPALPLARVPTRWTLAHSARSRAERVTSAHDTLRLMFDALEAYNKVFSKLHKQYMTDLELHAAVESVVTGLRTKKANQVVELFRNSPALEHVRHTRYAGLLAFAEWTDWGRRIVSDNARFEVSYEGYGARRRNALYRLMVGRELKQ